MFAAMFRAAVKMLALAACIYAAFFVKLGQRTFAEHVSRIARTDEAQEFETEVVGALGTAKQEVVKRLGNPAPSGGR